MKEKKGFFAEFKEFITRGNVLDLAVGVIIGTAFTAIITSVVENLITPLIGLFMPNTEKFAEFAPAGFGIGAVINDIISFLITAFVLFCIVKAFNALNEKIKKPEEEAPVEEEISAELKTLNEIRDLLKEQAGK